jgi:hypothetical protein
MLFLFDMINNLSESEFTEFKNFQNQTIKFRNRKSDRVPP